MEKIGRGFLGGCLSLLVVIALKAQLAGADGVNVMATVNRNQVGVGDVVNLTVSVSSESSTNVDEPQLPAIPGFDLINSTSGMETRSTFVNGKFMTEQSRTFTYMLAVSQKGQLQIPPISVNVDGKSYSTQPITIAANGQRSGSPPVAGQGQQGGQPTDPFDQMDEMEEVFNQMLQRRLAPRAFPGGQQGRGGHQQQQNIPSVNPEEAFFIHAETDKQKAFVGEQVTASFYLYTRGSIRDIDTLKYPDLKSFWKEEIEMATRLNFEQVAVNGIPYQRALLVSYALFPIRPGSANIDPYKAKCTVITPSNFGFGRAYVFTKASRAISIDVMPLPTQGKPANYSGAVGNFRLTASFDPPTGTANQPVTLRVRFEGRGNAKLIELPKLDLPPSFEIYDQKSQAKFLKDGTSFKEFEVLIIPREPGVFKVAPVATAVFDSQSHKYTEIASQPLSLAVTGMASVVSPVQAQKSPGAKSPETPEHSLPSLVTDMEVGSSLPAQAMPAITIGLYLMVFGLLVQQGWAKLRQKPKRANLNLVLNTRLKKIRSLVGKNEWRRVGVEMTNATYYLLGQLTNLGGASHELERMLENTPPSLRDELAAPIRKLLAQSEMLSFAPDSMVGDSNTTAKLNSLVDEFERVMRRALQLAEI